jgi:hypothetical protein
MISVNPHRERATMLGCLRRWQVIGLAAFALAGDGDCPAAPAAALELSVYCTAGDVGRYLGTADARQQVLHVLQPLNVGRVFLEGRRGDQYVSPAQLRELRDWFAAQGIQCSGGIATVPGGNFGQRQQGGLEWLNWENQKTRTDVAAFFAENAPVFPELVVDDFSLVFHSELKIAVQSFNTAPLFNIIHTGCQLVARMIQVSPNAKCFHNLPELA